MVGRGERLQKGFAPPVVLHASRGVFMRVRVYERELREFTGAVSTLGVQISDLVRMFARNLLSGSALDGKRTRYRSGHWVVDPELDSAKRPPMPDLNTNVEPEVFPVTVGMIGLLTCVTYPRGRRYHFTGRFSHKPRGRATSYPVLDGHVDTTADGVETYAMGIARVTRLCDNGLVTVEPLPDEYVYGWLDTQAHGYLRQGYALYDKDFLAHLVHDRGGLLDGLHRGDPDCEVCTRWHRLTKRNLERAEADGFYRVRVTRPCVEHGRRDVCQLYFSDNCRTVITAVARDRFGVGHGGTRLPDDWDGVPSEQRSVEYDYE